MQIAKKEITNSVITTPEIMARSRQSLTGFTTKMKKINRQRELEDLKEALKESQEQRQATSIAYMKISQKLTNSVPITPGPNINKPRVTRPQDTAYQAVMQ
jgi:hypothetical protein